MLSVDKMKRLIAKMEENKLEANYQLIELLFEDVNEVNEYGENILHYFVSEKYDEEKCYFAIKTLLKYGIDPNFVDNCKYNFIQTAIDTGYSERFVFFCIRESLHYNLDVNHQEEDGDTIIHTALRADDYSDGVSRLLNLLFYNGYNPHIKNNEGKEIDDLIFESKKYSNKQKRKMIVEMDEILSCPPNLKYAKNPNIKY